jgi:putative transposase
MQAEIIALRHQLTVLQRRQKRSFSIVAIVVCGYGCHGCGPGWRSSLIIVKPETVIGWHRQGFRWYWTANRRQRLGIGSIVLPSISPPRSSDQCMP